MTENNLFVYKLVLLLNILDFNLLFRYKLQSPLKKVTPSLPATPSENCDLAKPYLFENLVRGSTPLPTQAQNRAGCVYYGLGQESWRLKYV